VIKAIIFDLGKTVIPFDFQRAYMAIQEFCAYRAADIPKRLSTSDLVLRFEQGLVEPHDFVRQLSELLEARIGYDQFCRIWSSIFLPETLVPDSLIEALRERYRVLLLSNTNAIHFPMVRDAYPILRHFDDYVLSYEVRALKPSPLIYRAAIERAGCRPEECFFTDDIAAYVEAACEQGMHAAQFVSREQLEDDLRACGVEWRKTHK
jgi:putative hydrolase of the HAD superfamily